jgi:predicted negative regulator of RcsB-dependent stress response
MTNDERMRDFVKKHPSSLLVFMFLVLGLLMVMAWAAGQMHRDELDAKEIDSRGYVELLETVRTYPALEKPANEMAADGMVTAGERDAIMAQATAIQRDRTLSALKHAN